MASGSFEMDYAMPDLTDDFDFGEWLNFPADDLDQGGLDGCNMMPHTDVPDPYFPTLLGSSEGSSVRQSPDTQSGTNIVLPGSSHGEDNHDLYGDVACANGNLRPMDTSVLETAGSEIIAPTNCTEPRTVTQAPSRSFDPHMPNGSSCPLKCACISCLQIGICYYYAPWIKGKGRKCRFPGCSTVSQGSYFCRTFYDHEKSHYGQPGKYTCLEQDCPVVTKSFGDLKRHDKAKHCINPNKEQFPCPVLWCKYSGNNGFARKDKLKSHYKNIHKGKLEPAKAGRVIKPATLKPRV